MNNIKDMNETDFKVSINLQIDPIQVVFIKKAEIKFKKDELTTYMEKVKKEKSASDKNASNEKSSDNEKIKEEEEKAPDNEK